MARPLAGSIAFVTAVALSGSALAQDRQDTSPRTMTVHYSDLNISTTAGARALYQRIRGAAGLVCGAHTDRLGVYAWRDWDSCVHTAVNDAVEKVHSPLLHAVQRNSDPETRITAMLGH
jgi:UrcA family protein